jgi:hypothetical protein
MAEQNSQNLMALINSMTPQQIRNLAGILKGAQNKGMDKFEKARKAAIDGFFAATKIHYDTHVNPDYSYEFQEYPKILYAVVETQNGTEVAWMQFESPDETLGLGEEWCANPTLAKAYYNTLNELTEPQPVTKVHPASRKKNQPQGELAHV